METVLDQGLLGLHYVIIEFVDLSIELLVGTGRIEFQVVIQVHACDNIAELRTYQSHVLILALCGRVHVVLYRPFHLLELIITSGTCHGGDHVIDYDGCTAPLGLYALTGIPYDVRIDIRKRVKDVIGTAVPRHGCSLPRQPFQCTMRTNMDDCIRTEIVPQPPVVCEILMRHNAEGVVIIRLYVPSTVRLETHYDVAEHRSRDRYLPIHGVEIAGWLPPIVLDAIAS